MKIVNGFEVASEKPVAVVVAFSVYVPMVLIDRFGNVAIPLAPVVAVFCDRHAGTVQAGPDATVRVTLPPLTGPHEFDRVTATGGGIAEPATALWGWAENVCANPLGGGPLVVGLD